MRIGERVEVFTGEVPTKMGDVFVVPGLAYDPVEHWLSNHCDDDLVAVLSDDVLTIKVKTEVPKPVSVAERPIPLKVSAAMEQRFASKEGE